MNKNIIFGPIARSLTAVLPTTSIYGCAASAKETGTASGSARSARHLPAGSKLLKEKNKQL